MIVTYEWPPRNSIGAHRPYAWAKYWSQAGERVTVLTAKKQAFDKPLDSCLEHLPDVKVVEIAYGNKNKLINALLKFDGLRALARNLKAWVGKKGVSIGDMRSSWRDAAYEVAISLAKENDVIVSTYGPTAAHLIANDMKSAYPDLFWVADYRDLWSQSHTVTYSEESRACARDLELNTVGLRADLISAVSDDLVARLENFVSKKAIQIPNGFDVDFDILERRLAKPLAQGGRPFRIVYTGTIYEGHQDPWPLLNALVNLRDRGEFDEGEVTVDFYGGRVDLARRLARIRRYSTLIRLMGHVSRDVALDAQRNSSLLLILESPAEEARGVLTGKLFEYISSARPILCIGSRPEYEIGKVLKATGTGSVFGPEEFGELETFLLATIRGKGLYDFYAPKISEIMKFSRKRSSFNMLDEIKRNIGSDG